MSFRARDLTSVTDAEWNVTTYVFSNRDLMTSQTSPVSGVTTWAYDDQGEMISEIDARGIIRSGVVDQDHSIESIYAVGNPTAIADNLSPAGPRTYTYQDYAYFLTSGNGPWGTQSWTYDKIGNRLTEIDEGFESIYTYPLNPAAGHNPKFQSTTAPRGLTFTYGYDAAGNQTTVTETGPEGSGRTITYGYDAASRLAGFSSDYGPASTAVAYDGRGFLRESAKTYTSSAAAASAAATYGSEGLLYSRFQSEQSIKGNVLDGTALRATVAIEKRTDVLYFAGRPVALRVAHVGGTSNLLYLTTDHLGTPVLTTDEAGAKVWAGGFEPFGSDFNFVQNTEMFLRFPGQWWGGSFGGYAFRDETYYNVHRWYGVGTGRYGRPDPLGSVDPDLIEEGNQPLFTYATARPTLLTDPFGLLALPPGGACDNFNDIIQGLQQVAQNPCCTGFFSQLGADLPSLIQGSTPTLRTFPTPSIHAPMRRSGFFDCARDSGNVHVAQKFCDRPLLFRQRRVRQATVVVLHELAHYADCNSNGNRYPGEEGQAAEIACFGEVLSGDAN